MPANLEQILISVWKQALLDETKTVNVCGQSFRVQRTSRSKLREVDFECEGQKLRGLRSRGSPRHAARAAPSGGEATRLRRRAR